MLLLILELLLQVKRIYMYDIIYQYVNLTYKGIGLINIKLYILILYIYIYIININIIFITNIRKNFLSKN